MHYLYTLLMTTLLVTPAMATEKTSGKAEEPCTCKLDDPPKTEAAADLLSALKTPANTSGTTPSPSTQLD